MRASRGPARQQPWQPRQRVVLSLRPIGGPAEGEPSSGLLARFSPLLESWVRKRRSRSRFKGRSIVQLPCLLLAFGNFHAATIHITRKKHGQPATHQVRGDELKALRKLQKEQEPKSAFVFTSERGGALFSRDSFNWMVKRAGKKAKLPFQVHAHVIRHATGYKLANAGKDTRSIQGYLGHKDIRHTVRYTELSPTRFKNFWPD